MAPKGEIPDNVGTYIARRLQQIGVTEYFAVPGDFNLVLLDQLLLFSDLKQIGCCNELNAGYAADGYARAKGVGVVITTFMVGGLSAVNAIAGAYAEDLPVIIISGGANSNDFASDRILHHTIGLVERRQQFDIYKHITAEAVEVRSPLLAARQIDHAIGTALAQRKPVYIEVACNIATEPISAPIPFRFPPKPPSNSAALAAAVQTTLDMWDKAAKPVIVVGVKVRTVKAFDAVEKLASAAGCAIAVMPDAKGVFPEDHPGFIGTYWGSVSSPSCCEIVESADMYIFLGPVFTDYSTTGYTTHIKKGSLVKALVDRVEAPGAEFGCTYLAEYCEALASKITAKDATLRSYRRIFSRESSRRERSDDDPLDMLFVRNVVQGLLTDKTTLMLETGDSWFHGQQMSLPRGCGYQFQMQYGSIGWSVGAVLGYAVAAKAENRRVIAMIGDGSFQMTAQEISTMIRFNVNPIIFLINNRGYTIEIEIHDGPYNEIKNWDYVKLTHAFAGDDAKAFSVRVGKVAELKAAVKEALAFDGLSLIELTIDKDDCARQLLQWGSLVATANSRKYVEL